MDSDDSDRFELNPVITLDDEVPPSMVEFSDKYRDVNKFEDIIQAEEDCKLILQLDLFQ